MSAVGGGANARPPNYLKSVEVVNRSTKRTGVTVLYKNIRDAQPNDPKPPEIKLSADLLPGKSFVFPSLSLDMGGWEAVAPILSVAAGKYRALIQATGVVNKQTWVITPSGELKRQQQP